MVETHILTPFHSLLSRDLDIPPLGVVAILIRDLGIVNVIVLSRFTPCVVLGMVIVNGYEEILLLQETFGSELGVPSRFSRLVEQVESRYCNEEVEKVEEVGLPDHDA
jgi:hypothetical protein